MKEFDHTIKTKRLLLIPFSEKHLSIKYVSWLNDPALMRYSEQRHKMHTRKSCESYWQSFYNTPNILWAIEESIKGFGHIGNINAYIDNHNEIADVGILIGDAGAQGHEYGYEALKGASEYLFNNIEIRKITVGTVSVNLSMIKLMKKMKMREDGTRKRHYFIEGEEVDIIHMALFKEDYDALS
jgi:RimJ/RimL family protein N-acetyltransferase